MRKSTTTILSLLLLSCSGVAAQQPVNNAGELLLSTDLMDVYKQQRMRFFNPLESCNDYGFEVSVEYKLDSSAVLSREFIYDSLFDSVLRELRKTHCPQAQHKLQASIFYKDHLINAGGELISRAEAANVFPGVFAHATIYAQESGSISDYGIDSLRVRYFDGDRRVDVDQAEELLEFGSMDRLQAYVARGRMTIAQENARNARVDEAVRYRQGVVQEYGVQFRNMKLAYILNSDLDKLSWHGGEHWQTLRSYVWTLSELCGNKTAGVPMMSVLQWSDSSGDRDSDFEYWHSAKLEPALKDKVWGGIFGLNRFDEATQADVTALVDVHGCGSAPFEKIEDYFASGS